MKSLDSVADLVGASHRFVISQTKSPAGTVRRASVDLNGLIERMMEL